MEINIAVNAKPLSSVRAILWNNNCLYRITTTIQKLFGHFSVTVCRFGPRKAEKPLRDDLKDLFTIITRNDLLIVSVLMSSSSMGNSA